MYMYSSAQQSYLPRKENSAAPFRFLSLEMEFFEGQRKEHPNLRLEG